MRRIEMELRNVPINRVQEYLVEAGAKLVGDRRAEGPDWFADLIKMEPVQLGVMNIRRDLLVLSGENEISLTAAYDHMRQRTMRGGG